MFQIHGLHGHVIAGTLEEVRRLSPVNAATRMRRVAAGETGAPAPGAGAVTVGNGPRAASAYGAVAAGPRRAPLSRVGDVMHQPAVTVPASASVGEAWRTLLQHHIGQAPVLAADGALVGLVGRAELLPIEQLVRSAADAPAWRALTVQPVAAVMWSPVPSVQPDQDLRLAAALLLGTGLPGAPVTDEAGRLVGFVSRSDLLRAIVHDPPLDLWG